MNKNRIMTVADLLTKSLILMIFTLFLTSCSTRLIYNYADWLISWKVGDYVDLNKTQKQTLDNKVAELLTWHRTEELPYYSSLLKQLRSIVVSKNEAALTELFEQAKTIWLRSAHKVTPEIIELLPLLSKKQQLELIENIESIQQEKNEQWLDELKDNPEQRFEDAEDRIEDYIGPLTAVQREYLLDIDGQRPNILPLRIEGRKRWLELFSRAILQQPKIDKVLLYKLFTDLSSHRSVEQQMLADKINQLNLSKAIYLLKSMTEQQQLTLLKKIDEIIIDLDLLAEQM